MQSPERLQARLEELAGGVEKERGLVADAERRARDLQARMDTITKVCPCYPMLLNATDTWHTAFVGTPESGSS